MRHLLVEQIQEFALNLWKQIDVLLHELIRLWLVDKQDMRSQIAYEIEIKCMLSSFQIWYFSFVVDFSNGDWICFGLGRHHVFILMLQWLIIHDLLSWQDHLRWLLRDLRLICISCFRWVCALSWIWRRIWSTGWPVWELRLEWETSYFLAAQRVRICIFAWVSLALTQDGWHPHKGCGHVSNLLWPGEAESGTGGKVLLLAHLALPGNFRNSSRRKWRPFCLQHSLHHLLWRHSLIPLCCLWLRLLLHGLQQIRDIG